MIDMPPSEPRIPLPNEGFTQDEHQSRYTRIMDAAKHDRTGFTGVVLGGACVEYYLRRILEASLAHADRLLLQDDHATERHYDVIVLLKLVWALGIVSDEQYRLFKEFAELRNHFAHNPDAFISSASSKIVFLRVLKAMKHPSHAVLNTPEMKRDGAGSDVAFAGLLDAIHTVATIAQAAHADSGRIITPALLADALREIEEQQWFDSQGPEPLD
jgi:hypothetical protein